MPTTTYRDVQTRKITDEKMANMTTMYDRFISFDSRPEYLPPLQTLTGPTSLTSAVSLSTMDSASAQANISRGRASAQLLVVMALDARIPLSTHKVTLPQQAVQNKTKLYCYSTSTHILILLVVLHQCNHGGSLLNVLVQTDCLKL